MIDGQLVEQNAVVFVCKLNDGSNRTFNARPRGSVERRVRWYNEIDSLIGKPLTVRFLEYSEEGVPTGNTVGIAIRDYE